MADLPQVREELLGVLPAEQLRHLRVLQAPGPHTRRHGKRLARAEETRWVSACLLGRWRQTLLLENMQCRKYMPSSLPRIISALGSSEKLHRLLFSRDRKGTCEKKEQNQEKQTKNNKLKHFYQIRSTEDVRHIHSA